MSFRFRRRPDSANTQNQQDPYFDPNNVGQPYQDYHSQPSMGNAYIQGYDPRYQHPVMPGTLNNSAGYDNSYQQSEPYFASQQQYDSYAQAAYNNGNFQQGDFGRYNPAQQHQPQQNFQPSSGGFESNAYMHPFQSNQIPRQNMASAVAYQNQGAIGEKNRGFSFWKDSNNSQQTGFEEPELESSSPVKLLVSVVGVAILAGLSWFAYKWVKSPGSDNPPLIHAEEGPHKVRPDHKGGVNIPYQDKLIYDRISDSEQPEERLLPPPEEPVQINQPMQTQVAPDGMMIQQPMLQQQAPQQQGAQQYQQSMQAPQQYAPNQPYPQQQYQQPQPMVNGQMQQMQNQNNYQQQMPVTPVQQQQVINSDSVDVEKEKPATSAKGTFFVQLATVKSEEAALREWKRLKNKHGLQNQKSQIKEFETAEGDTVYRLLMGPFDDKVKALKHAVKIDGTKIVQMAD